MRLDQITTIEYAGLTFKAIHARDFAGIVALHNNRLYKISNDGNYFKLVISSCGLINDDFVIYRTHRHLRFHEAIELASKKAAIQRFKDFLNYKLW